MWHSTTTILEHSVYVTFCNSCNILQLPNHDQSGQIQKATPDKRTGTDFLPSPSEFWRDAAPLKRKACLARLRSPKLRLLGTLEGLSSMLLSALGERRGGCWPWGEFFPLFAEFLGLENTRSFRLTFWL